MAKNKNKVKKKPHVVLVLCLIILLVPCAILGSILYQSLEDSSKPVVGDRYEGQLDPAITEENVTALQSALAAFEGVENVEVNLKTARVGIMINTKDDLTKEQIEQIIKDAYTKVNEILPIETYFTNKYGEDETYVKMYDLQIDAYNVTSGETQTHYIITKTGAQEKEMLQLVSVAKDEEVANGILNPEKGEE